MRVLLVSMPFPPFNPSSQIGVLKGYLDAHPAPDRTVETAHLSVPLVKRTGLDDWETLSNVTAGIKVGILLFQRFLFDARDRSAADLLGPAFFASAADSGVSLEQVARWQSLVEAFWTDLLSGLLVDLDGWDVFGFSTVFNQLFPSLALAREVKRRNSGCRVVFGGVEVHGQCGADVLSRFPFVDAVVEGRGERALDALLREWAAGSDGSGVAGVRTRSNPLSPRPAAQAVEFGSPDHDGFFRALDRHGIPVHGITGIPIEASQGCFWRRCDFCGTREVFPRYRLKAAEAIRQEVERAVERHGVYHLIFTDEAVPTRRLIEALSPLAGESWFGHVAFLAQVRASISRKDLEALAGLGLRVAQVGIESFSTAVLSRMDKGVTALENIRCLKWCRELGISVDYNLILGYPFASDEDLMVQARQFPVLWHLDPPLLSDFYVHRFSRLFCEKALPPGCTLRPAPIYNLDLFPERLAGLSVIAHEPAFADISRSPGDEAIEAAALLWRQRHRPGMLHFLHGRGFVRIEDSRGPRHRIVKLQGLIAEVFRFCDDIRTRDEIARHFGDRADSAFTAIRTLAEAGYLITDRDAVLCVVPAFQGRVGWDSGAWAAEKR